MQLKLNTFVGLAVLAISTGAAAQNTPPTSPPGQTQTSPGDASQTAPGQTGVTPGQMQTMPGDASQDTPAATGQTPSGQTTGQAGTSALQAASEADFKKGATVYDQSGAKIGKIQSYSASGVVVSTGKARAEIPLASFGRGDKGLVLGMSKADFEAATSAKKTK